MLVVEVDDVFVTPTVVEVVELVDVTAVTRVVLEVVSPPPVLSDGNDVAVLGSPGALTVVVDASAVASGVVLVSAGRAAGMVPLASMTLPRTIETAPQDRARATMSARAHPPMSRVQVGMR